MTIAEGVRAGGCEEGGGAGAADVDLAVADDVEVVHRQPAARDGRERDVQVDAEEVVLGDKETKNESFGVARTICTLHTHKTES